MHVYKALDGTPAHREGKGKVGGGKKATSAVSIPKHRGEACERTGPLTAATNTSFGDMDTSFGDMDVLHTIVTVARVANKLLFCIYLARKSPACFIAWAYGRSFARRRVAG